ncbi:MAG: hypothetical protein QF472_05865 [Candidatus Marinimicrobia bacterium]|nr:hypothetical protein [Candidatus Neomarinimicrobiota bacterium]
MDKKIILLLTGIVLSVLNSQTLLNRLRVPVTIQSSIAFGYDSNFLRLSEKEMNESNPAELGISSTFDSPVVKPGVKFLYSPFLWEGHTTKLTASVNYSAYTQSLQKNYNISQLSLAIKLKPYSWIKTGYRMIPQYYLRKYRDRDVSLTDYKECNFSSDKLFVSFSHPLPFLSKGWFQTTLEQTTEFYNSLFTEFDLIKLTMSGDVNFRIWKKKKIKISLSHTSADNISYKTSLPSTNVDRSYVADKLKISFSGKVKKIALLQSIGISQSIEQRYYDLVSTHYSLDNWKNYIDGRTNIWMDWKQYFNLNIRTRCQYRWRDADSNIAGDFEWIEDIKSYQKIEFWVEFDYDFTWEGLY